MYHTQLYLLFFILLVYVQLQAGFEFTSDTSHLVLDETKFGLMMQVRELVEDRWNEEQDGYKKAAEKVINKSNEKQEQEQAKLERKRSAVKNKIALEQKDLSQEFKPKIDSKAKNLKFGKTDVKVEFKQGGG